MPRPSCPKCGETQCSRRDREGLLQIFVFPHLGLFPWHCPKCRKTFVAKERGKSKIRHREEDLQKVAAERAANLSHGTAETRERRRANDEYADH